MSMPIPQLVQTCLDQYRLIQFAEEFVPLMEQVTALKPRTIVEIGTNTAASIWAFGQISDPDTLLITIDLSDVRLVRGPFARYIWTPTRVWRFPRPSLGVRLRDSERTVYRVVGNSQISPTRRLVEALMQLHGRSQIDFLFIDGDHSAEGVRRDFTLFAPLVREGGIVAFHDIADSDWMREHHCYVYQLWSEVKADSGWSATELTKEPPEESGQVMGIGVLAKLPGAAVESAAHPAPALRWGAYRLRHMLTIVPQYLIHLAGGAIKRLLGRSA